MFDVSRLGRKPPKHCSVPAMATLQPKLLEPKGKHEIIVEYPELVYR